MQTNNYTHITGQIGDDIAPFPLQGQTLFRFPKGADTSSQENPYLAGAPAAWTFENIKNQLHDYGFSVVMAHPQEFANWDPTGNGSYVNAVNQTQMAELVKLLDSITLRGVLTKIVIIAAGIRIVPVGRINTDAPLTYGTVVTSAPVTTAPATTAVTTAPATTAVTSAPTTTAQTSQQATTLATTVPPATTDVPATTQQAATTQEAVTTQAPQTSQKEETTQAPVPTTQTPQTSVAQTTRTPVTTQTPVTTRPVGTTNTPASSNNQTPGTEDGSHKENENSSKSNENEFTTLPVVALVFIAIGFALFIIALVAVAIFIVKRANRKDSDNIM